MSAPTPKAGKGRIRSLVRRGSEAGKQPRGGAAGAAPPEGSVCRRCGAAYRRRTWRRGRPGASAGKSAAALLCPACAQVEREDAFGSVTARGGFLVEHGAEILRRIDNVCRRAGRTQPERKLVSVRLEGDRLEVRTTSQKLAHRIASELSKAFGGRASYDWIDRDGTLRAVWEPRARPA
ncbi:MAG: hypothetical protein HYY35_03705 [Deltaproteobacteria bacterium]|nr:hypothetical protein [Deltaproteobacteria bacterium]